MKPLTRLINLRKSSRKLDEEIKLITPDAIVQALEVLESNADNKKQVVYEDQDKNRIILNFRKRFLTPKESPQLARLDADIQGRLALLRQQNADKLLEIEVQIQAYEDAIEKLEQQREQLLCDRRLARLKAQFKVCQEDSMYLDPNLAVYLTK
ncbi:MAG: hypothetical protein ACLFQP_00550 [Halothece sp.]